MKKDIITTISILAMVIMVSIYNVSAEERHIAIEMGESGQIVSFPMTSEEIAALEAENVRGVKSKARTSQQAAPRFKTFEMGESGQIVSFLMTSEEIAAEDAAKQRLFESRRKGSVDDRQTVTYEMAESGVVIEYPPPEIYCRKILNKDPRIQDQQTPIDY